MKAYYITTAIPYVNARPHVGFALEIIQADALARYQRLFGRDVRFLTGTDDNSLTNVQAAEREDVPVAELVKRNARHFEALKGQLELSNDDFIRTSTEPRHRLGVEKLWRACDARGDIYKKRYQGLYCVGCEQFYTPDELVDGKCPDHATVPELVEEENYFFRLSKYQERLEALIESDAYRIVPRTRKNEVLSFIRGGLQDFSVSRSVQRAKGWGIPVPGDPSQVVYVWFDALSNYINALGYADQGPLYRKYWEECPERVHVIGKGIIRFHAVYWPAMLMSAGVPLPHQLLVHGYITIDGQKMSKTLGNVVEPVQAASRYGSDQLRYYLLSEVSTTGDGDYGDARMAQRINSDLANDYGNLASRVFKMVESYCGGVMPKAKKLTSDDEELKALALGLEGKAKAAVDGFDLNTALSAVMDAVKATNRYIESNAPWKLFKQGDQERIDTVLNTAAETLRICSVLMSPAMPSKCRQLMARLGIPDEPLLEQAQRWGLVKPGTKIAAGEPLFPRIDTKTKIDPSTALGVRGERRMAGESKPKEEVKSEKVAVAPAEELVDIDYFKRIKLRTADVISAEKVEGADKLLRLQIRIGGEARQILAGIAQWYPPESLVGKQIVVVANLKPAKIRGLESNGMLLAAQDKDGVVILTPERRTESGSGIK